MALKSDVSIYVIYVHMKPWISNRGRITTQYSRGNSQKSAQTEVNMNKRRARLVVSHSDITAPLILAVW
jgi:hypothetical protein